MADSELGELRRPPRLVEQRIHRIAAWRAQGLAGGTSDDVFPADGDDDTLAADGGGEGDSGALPRWFADSFDLTSSTTSPFTLTYFPLEYSEVVRVNGVTLEPGIDYTISGRLLSFVDLTDLRLGIGADTWTVVASYAWIETAEDSPEIAGSSAFAGTSGSGPVTLEDDDLVVLFVHGEVTGVSGYADSWSKAYDGGAGAAVEGERGTLDVWVGSGIGAGSITLSGVDPVTQSGAAVLVLRGYGTGGALLVTALDSTEYPYPTLPATISETGSAPAGRLAAFAVRTVNGASTGATPDVVGTWTYAGFDDAVTLRAVGGGIYENGIGVVAGTIAEDGDWSVDMPLATYDQAASSYLFVIEGAV